MFLKSWEILERESWQKNQGTLIQQEKTCPRKICLISSFLLNLSVNKNNVKVVHFNKTLSFREDCAAYNQLIEKAKKAIRNELEWSTLNCTIAVPELNSHGRLDFKLIL